MSAEATSEAMQGRLPDWGPVYIETPDTYPFPQLIAEPWNAATAFLFVIVVVIWVIRLRGRYRQFPFLCCCLPLLLAGGIGGTLFHGLRISPVFFLMDVIPIYMLGVVASLYLWWRLGPKLHHLLGMVGLLVGLQLFGQLALPMQWAINVSYAALALIVIAPLVAALVRTRFRHGGLVTTAFVCFGVAWFCRIADTIRPPLLPMGTHWLWHVFGACCTLAISEYFYRIEGESLKPIPVTAAQSPAA